MARGKPEKSGKAQKDAKRDMKKEGFSKNQKCQHKGPWDSSGPLKDNRGFYTEYTCGDCGQEMRKHYYQD